MTDDVMKAMHKIVKVINDKTPEQNHYERMTAQVLCLAEEAGEFVGAWRRYATNARRSGTREEVELELADVLITALIMSAKLNLDPNELVMRKVRIIEERGGR